MQDEGRDVEKDPQSQPAVTVVDDKSQPSENDRDPNLVDFDGPDYPANAMNWSGKKKLANCAVIAFITLLTYVVPLRSDDQMKPGGNSVIIVPLARPCSLLVCQM